MSCSVSEAFVHRLLAVEGRLHAQAERHPEPGRTTDPDPRTGERWEAGQVWAHLAEFIPYWMGEADRVMAEGTTKPFGRTSSDRGRLTAIERDRAADRRALWQRVKDDAASLRRWLQALDPAAWRRRGVHPTLGTMSMTEIVEEFLIGHLEQHAEQLERLAENGTPDPRR